MNDDLQLLEIMLRDQRNQKGLYLPGPYWQQNSARVVDAIRRKGTQNFRAESSISKGYADSVVLDPFELLYVGGLKSRVYKTIVDSQIFRRYFATKYLANTGKHFRKSQEYRDLYFSEILGDWFSQFSTRYSLPETLIGNPQNTIAIRGKKMGGNYLDAFLRVHNYSETIDFDEVVSVFEVGGGYGAFCHSLLTLFPNIKKYLYLDIPPILYIGTQYLKHFFGDEVRDYRETRELDCIRFSPDDSREIIAITPWQIENVNIEIDLFWNSASFQEMAEDMVVNYSQHVDQMLRDDDAKLCLYVYKSEKSENTIAPRDLLGLIERNTTVVFDEIEPQHEARDAHYFVGFRR